MSTEPDSLSHAALSTAPATIGPENAEKSADAADREKAPAGRIPMPAPAADEAPAEASPAASAPNVDRAAPAASRGSWWPFGSLWSAPSPQVESTPPIASDANPCEPPQATVPPADATIANPSPTTLGAVQTADPIQAIGVVGAVTKVAATEPLSNPAVPPPTEPSRDPLPEASGVGSAPGASLNELLPDEFAMSEKNAPDEASPRSEAIASEAAPAATDPATPAAASYYDWFSSWFGSAAANAAPGGGQAGDSAAVFVAEIAPADAAAEPSPKQTGTEPAPVLEAFVASQTSAETSPAAVAAPLSATDSNGAASPTVPTAQGALVPAPTMFPGMLQSGVLQAGSLGAAAVDGVRASVVAALVAGIRMVSAERDRDEILRWFVGARQILAQEGTTAQTCAALYQSIDVGRFAHLLGNTLATSISNYQGANLPLSLKLALPATLLGMAFFGMQGAGLVAFGSGVGLPVVLLIFLGTAGATAVLEAFVKDRSIRDPLTKLLLTFAAYESARRAKKELLDALRADAMVPERAAAPDDAAELLEFLLAMDPVAFERHVMSFFAQEGHPTGLTARSNDFGVDGYVFHPDGLVVVQCKRYSLDNPVGRPEVQQFKGVIEEQRAYRGYFVTTSRFTSGAAESADKNDRLRLVDGEGLLRWHREGWKPG